jgi:nucleoside-diphosphate-sugar epimerase
MTSLLALHKQRILVTGASGFIGPHLCGRLHTLGAEVHGVSRNPLSSLAGTGHWWRADLSEGTAAQELFSTIKPNLVFHLAGLASGSRGLALVLPTFRSNLATTVNVLTSAAETGCARVVLANSMEEPDSNEPTTIPSSPYAVSKWASGAYGRMFHALYELPVVLLRVFMTYGPGCQDLRKLIPYVILKLLKGEAPELASGQRRIDWVYIDDVVDAFVAAALVENIEGQTIDIGSGELVTVRQIVEELGRLIEPAILPRFGSLQERPLEQVRAADREKSYAVLGWKSKVSLHDGLAKTIDWYKARLTGGVLSTNVLQGVANLMKDAV